MKINDKGIALIKNFEGLRLTAYKCSANVDTIGYGATFYRDGSKVKPGDKITQQQADDLLVYHLGLFADKVRKEIKATLSENQFSAVVSFTYNVGIGNLKKSTLLKKVNANPNDATIRAEFMKWNKAAGKVLNGLTRRRQTEADLYFS